MQDSRFVLLSNEDNVFVCCKRVQAGTEVYLDGKNVALTTEIHVGHKIARHDLVMGDKILKYGAPIGSVTKDVAFAEHVHMHNMKSDYIASHTRQSRAGE